MRGASDQQADLFDVQILQNLLPADHELKRIGAAIDWSFIDVETADLYSPFVAYSMCWWSSAGIGICCRVS